MKPLFESRAYQALLIDELDSWIGTPWAHMASTDGAHRAIKGVGGDCITIITTALTDAHFIEQLHFPGHIAKPGLATEEEAEHTIVRYLKDFIAIGRLSQIRPISDALLTGDLLTFKLGGSRAHHLGIYRGGPNRAFYHVPGPGHRFMLSALNEAHFGRALQSAYRLIENRQPAGAP